MSKPNQRSTPHLLIRIAITFCCFIVALIVLWYWGMGGDLSSVLSKNGMLSHLSDTPPDLFYQTIGVGVDADNTAIDKIASNMFTLELQVVATRSQADRMITDLLQRGIRAFYTEHTDKDGKKLFSVRRGLYSTLEEAQSASRIFLAQRAINNRVVALSP
ncbi:MAG: SPOR domain-containing protein [Pseudomonadota bacterium]|nr:SPOR domain-containing protein [Pseudomonadota bacterium]